MGLYNCPDLFELKGIKNNESGTSGAYEFICRVQTSQMKKYSTNCIKSIVLGPKVLMG